MFTGRCRWEAMGHQAGQSSLDRRLGDAVAIPEMGEVTRQGIAVLAEPL